MSDVVKEKRPTVATTVELNVYNALEDFRWPAHMKMSEVLLMAITEFMENHGIVVNDSTKV